MHLDLFFVPQILKKHNMIYQVYKNAYSHFKVEYKLVVASLTLKIGFQECLRTKWFIEEFRTKRNSTTSVV